MPETLFLKIKRWFTDVFETRTDVIVALAIILFILLNALKISLFNHYIVPNADR